MMKANSRYIGIAVLLILSGGLLSACAPAATPTNAPSARPSPQPPLPVQATTPTVVLPDVEPTLAPNPLAVRVTLDSQQAVSATISPAGGTLRLQAADGTAATLTLPAGALLSEEVITLTMVKGIDGLPLSNGLLAAVEMEPEGLRLFNLAELTIRPAAAFTAEELSGFGYYGAGDDFYLSPVQLQGTAIVFQITHFSGTGAGRGTAGDRARQQQRVPSRPEAQFLQQLSGGGNTDTVKSLYATWMHQIMPKIVSAKTNVAVLESAFADFAGWYLRVRAAGLEQYFVDEITEAIIGLSQGIKYSLEENYRLCVDEHDLNGALEMLRLLKFIGQLEDIQAAANLELVPLPLSPEVQVKVDACLRFDLEFDSTIAAVFDLSPFHVSFSGHVRSTVPLRVDLESLTVKGQADLEYVNFEPVYETNIPEVSCGYTDVSYGTSGNLQAEVDLGMNIGEVRAPALSNITLYLSPYTTVEHFSGACSGGGVTVEYPGTLEYQHSGHFQYLHSAELSLQQYAIRYWERDGAGDAIRIYSRSVPFGPGRIDEDTTFTLKHTPGQ